MTSLFQTFLVPRLTFICAQVILQEVCFAAVAVIHALNTAADHALRNILVHKYAGVLIQPRVCNELLQEGAQRGCQMSECFQVPA